VTRYKTARKLPKRAAFKQPLPSGPKIDAAMLKALAEYRGEVKRLPPGRGSRRVKLKRLELPQIGDRRGDGEEAEGSTG
jgi:hypothetical protein